MGKLTISMAIFHSFLYVYQRVLEIPCQLFLSTWVNQADDVSSPSGAVSAIVCNRKSAEGMSLGWSMSETMDTYPMSCVSCSVWVEQAENVKQDLPKIPGIFEHIQGFETEKPLSRISPLFVDGWVKVWGLEKIAEQMPSLEAPFLKICSIVYPLVMTNIAMV